MQIAPREYYPIVRQLYDPLDETTYYVRATIRNENTGQTIATEDLTDLGNQLFQKRWQAPGDTSGLGFWISISTRVYTDSGYTTLSQNHEQMVETHLIFDRSRPLGGGSSGGGEGVSYKKIKETVSELLDERKKKEEKANKKEEPEEEPEPEEKIDLGPLMEMMSGISVSISEIASNMATRDNFDALTGNMKEVKDQVIELQTERNEGDEVQASTLESLDNKIIETQTLITKATDAVTKATDQNKELAGDIQTAVKEVATMLNQYTENMKIIGQAKSLLNGIPLEIPSVAREEAKQEPKTYDALFNLK